MGEGREGAASTTRVLFLDRKNQIVHLLRCNFSRNLLVLFFQKLCFRLESLLRRHFIDYLKLYKSGKVFIWQFTIIIGPYHTDLVTGTVMVS